jgi:hypothetical protein
MIQPRVQKFQSMTHDERRYEGRRVQSDGNREGAACLVVFDGNVVFVLIIVLAEQMG